MSVFTDYEEPVQPPAYTLHPIRGVTWATFWGTPLAGGVVMALNFRRTGDSASARAALLTGLFASVALVGLFLVLPEHVTDRIPSAAIMIPQLVAVNGIATRLQGEMLSDHEDRGGKIASAWRGVGIGILCLIPFLLVIFGSAMALEPSFGTRVAFGNDEVYYTEDATEADAHTLAGELREAKFFGGPGVSVQISATNGQYTVSFVMVEEAWNNAEVVGYFRAGGRLLALKFGTPLTIQLCNEYFEPQNTITITEDDLDVLFEPALGDAA